MAFDRHAHCAVCNQPALSLIQPIPMLAPVPYWLSGEHSIARCNACGFIASLSPSDQAAYTAYYMELNKHHRRDAAGTALDERYFAELIAYIARFSEARSHVLDFGSGALILSQMMADQGYTNLDNWDVAGKPLPSDTYHIAVSTHVFEHLYEPAQELAAIHDTLAPGGIFFLAVPDVTTYHRCYTGPYNGFDMEHINHFSPATLALFVTRGGFEVLDVMQTEREVSPGVTYSEVRVAARKSANPTSPVITPDSSAGLEEYLDHSKQDLLKLEHWLESIPTHPGSKLGLWGIGSYAMRAMTRCKRHLDFCNDSDPRLTGRSFMGNTILNAESFDAYLAALPADAQVDILVIAVNHTRLKRFIRERYGARVKVHCPYEAGILAA